MTPPRPPTAPSDEPFSPPPLERLREAIAYGVPRPLIPTDLALDGNEGPLPDRALLRSLAERDPALVRAYPRAAAAAFERQLAAHHGIEHARVLVTAGGDDALDRACRVMLAPGRSLVFPSPSFEMLLRYARLSGAEIIEVPWLEGPYPVDAVLAAARDTTTMIAVVSPNNPTGAIAHAHDVERLARARPHTLVLLDLAYTEFTEHELCAPALQLPNVLVVRTFSKAYGLAGLRVGYALGHPRLIAWMRAAGAPYPVSGLSLALAAAQLERGKQAIAPFVAAVRREREALRTLLERLGLRAQRSHANFVLARLPDPLWLRDALAGLGIAVRIFPGRRHLEDAVRISLPGDAERFERLGAALRTVLAPEALLFDLDGVLADVSRSYRQAIIDTAAHWGVRIGSRQIAEEKARGDANNDWVLTHRLLRRHGVEVSLDEVTGVFEAHYQGSATRPGLHERETPLVPRALLERLAHRLPLGIVTGRPRRDAERFLERHRLRALFRTLVCMEDTARPKPDPAPLRLALHRLGIEHAWFVGDTIDDVVAARRAGLLPIGVVAPGEPRRAAAERLRDAGAARVLDTLEAIEEKLP